MNGIIAHTPFDAMAAGYDASFTRTQIGVLLRQAVWQRLDTRFTAGDRILELNCGTGEDALHLALRGVQVHATDVAETMVEAARAKVARAGMQGRVTVERMALEELAGFASDPMQAEHFPMRSLAFDGALSNFGGLNCVSDWNGIAEGLAAYLRPGAVAFLCVMGPYCAWEWVWHLLQGQPGKAFRRLQRGGVSWRGLTIRYPSLRALRRAFSPHFRLVRAAAIGLLLPPTYAETWAARHPRLLARLNQWERRIEALPLMPSLADHYLLEMEKIESSGQ